MSDALDVVAAEGRRQARFHDWLRMLYVAAAWLAPFVGALSSHQVRCTFGHTATSVLVLGSACTCACHLGRLGGRHEAARCAFAEVARGPHRDIATAVSDLNRAYAMTDRNDMRDSPVTVRPTRPLPRTSMQEVSIRAV